MVYVNAAGEQKRKHSMSRRKQLFLDLEASGTDPVKHSILSIGMVISDSNLEDYESFYKEIRYEELNIMPGAIEVNGFDFTSQRNRIPLSQADEEAEGFVRRHFHGEEPFIIGLNIGTFDMQFIYRNMPLLGESISNKSVDLNSLIYFLAEKKSIGFKELKAELTSIADSEVSKLGLGITKHNALYDALFNLSLYSLLKKEFNIGPS